MPHAKHAKMPFAPHVIEISATTWEQAASQLAATYVEIASAMDTYLRHFSIGPAEIHSVRFDFQDDTGRMFAVLVGGRLAFSSGRFAILHLPLIHTEYTAAAAKFRDAGTATAIFERLHQRIHDCVSKSLVDSHAAKFVEVIKQRDYTVWLRDYNDRGSGTRLFPPQT
ncbi:MAG: hypothetical protein KDA51_01640 [Planctomycetales bacterium]|nr:hypothetical protein [Planctomycetales bacterium]